MIPKFQSGPDSHDLRLHDLQLNAMQSHQLSTRLLWNLPFGLDLDALRRSRFHWTVLSAKTSRISDPL